MKKLLLLPIIILGIFFFADDSSATTYYIDCTTGSTTAIGTATSTAGADLDQFTEVARTAGDIAIIRRGGTVCGDGTDLNFTSDGTIAAPLQIIADYGNYWGDFASSSQTYTIAVGSTTITADGTITNQMFADTFGKWIYVQGDDNTLYSYEVSATTTNTITLYLPYKGENAGSGKTLNIMPYAPVWNTESGDFQWNFDTDNYWKIQGLQIRGTDANGVVEIDSSYNHQFIDCITRADSGVDYNFNLTDDIFSLKLIKSRDSSLYGAVFGGADIYGYLELNNYYSYNRAGSYSIRFSSLNASAYMKIIDSYFVGNNTGILAPQISFMYARNLYNEDKNIDLNNNNDAVSHFVNMEDYQNIIGNNSQFFGLSTADDISNLISTTTASLIRSGGGNSSIEVIPTTNFNSNWDFGKIQLFEYPIQADTTNKTYTVYFMSPSDTWTVNPTASELWIECEYWDFGANSASSRKVKKSTGTVDFNGSTAWQSISVTCQPTTTGILYLRSFYAKGKEAGTNLFYVDVAPVISTP